MPDNLPNDLVVACQSNKLIPVVGTGVSMSLVDESGENIFPSWSGLLGYAAAELMKSGEQKHANVITSMLEIKQYPLAAKFAREGLQGAIWGQFFRKHFEEPLTRITEDSKALPRAIWGLGNRVLTLNYDKVLRIACPNSGRVVELDNNNKGGLADFKRNDLQAPVIWHFHGRVDDMSTIIFTAETYDALYAETNEKYKAALEIFRRLCSDQVLLFVGCSLEDAELLHEIASQHQLFDGNTGPHFALVHKNEHDAIKQKIGNLPVKLITFEDFGAPLLERVHAISSCVPQQKLANKKEEQSPTEQLPIQTATQAKKIAMLTASPINEEQQYTKLLKEIRKISCNIDHLSLSIDNLNNLQGYDYLLVLSKVIKNKLLIEDDHLCSKRISFEELESQIGNDQTTGVFIFVDRMPEPSATATLKLPTLILPELGKKQLESFAFKLFKRNNLDDFANCQILNRSAFELSPLSEKNKSKNNIQQLITQLPDNIDPKTLRNFIGRIDDLEQICRKLLALEEEGGVLTIKGAGGIGKTTTVKKITVALADRGYFEGGISFVDCEPISDCQQFKYKVAGAFNLEQAEDLRQHLRDHHDGLSRLIILDNFETLLYLDDHQEINTLLGLICDYSTIVITSRERLQIHGETVYEMRQFTTDEAVELFRAALDHREISPSELTLLRQEIIENLLDNNPLAIKLITGNMPKGKSFEALKQELETDLFSKISDSDLEVFDNNSDINISRKKSIYGSILYSYKHLTSNEQRAFELLSLFPDGIDLETFKRLTHDRKDPKDSSKGELKPLMITDKIIRALENKSMIENNSGHIKLQSIVGKFADAQLQQRDNITRYYRNALDYNSWLASSLLEYRETHEKRALGIFNRNQGNFLKSISYCDKVDIDNSELVDYLDNLSALFSHICSLEGFIRELTAKTYVFQGSDRQCVDVILLNARYFNGDFKNAFAELKQRIPLVTLESFDRSMNSNKVLIGTARNIYKMEGEALWSLKYAAKHKIPLLGYSGALLCLGEFSLQLVESCRLDFTCLEVRYNMGLLTLDEIDGYIASLYDKTHLERMQVSYTRSKLMQLKRQEVESLVMVNPYTRGIKGLMLAFVEQDIIKADELYQHAIIQLEHIKYYYVEALYYYAKFLQTNNQIEFDRHYSQGFDLAQKHHYRFLQYRFEQLLQSTGRVYDPCDYPFPENENFADYIHFLAQNNTQN